MQWVRADQIPQAFNDDSGSDADYESGPEAGPSSLRLVRPDEEDLAPRQVCPTCGASTFGQCQDCNGRTTPPAITEAAAAATAQELVAAEEEQRKKNEREPKAEERGQRRATERAERERKVAEQEAKRKKEKEEQEKLRREELRKKQKEKEEQRRKEKEEKEKKKQEELEERRKKAREEMEKKELEAKRLRGLQVQKAMGSISRLAPGELIWDLPADFGKDESEPSSSTAVPQATPLPILNDPNKSCACEECAEKKPHSSYKRLDDSDQEE
ncbi:hypothetical protein Q8F55_008552 [Vanrija albida]|uniref:Stress response protein NST1 n=1 Tax=Vanrija albida TaxID=181172 RepID=A0ABR3PR60_9TREE